MGKTGEQIVVVLMAIVGLAVIATLVSKNAQTSHVIQSGFSGFATALTAAIAPVTGGIGNTSVF